MLDGSVIILLSGRNKLCFLVEWQNFWLQLEQIYWMFSDFVIR